MHFAPVSGLMLQSYLPHSRKYFARPADPESGFHISLNDATEYGASGMNSVKEEAPLTDLMFLKEGDVIARVEVSCITSSGPSTTCDSTQNSLGCQRPAQ